MSSIVDAIDRINTLCSTVGVQPPVSTDFEAALARALGGPGAAANSATGTSTGTTVGTGVAGAAGGVLGASASLIGSAAGSLTGRPSGTLVAPVSGPVTSGWGPRINPVTNQPEFHQGIDLAAPEGTPVQAAASGTVTYAGWMSGYGNVVFVDSPGGMQTRYGHESSLAVTVGQQVSAGQTLGAVGSTGLSTGPHVYFQVLQSGTAVDPSSYLGLPANGDVLPASGAATTVLPASGAATT